MIHTDKELILDKVRKGAKYWHVAEKETDKKFIQEQDEDINPDDSAELLQNTFDKLSGIVYVQISQSSKAERVKNSDYQTGTYRYYAKCFRAPINQQPHVTGSMVPLDQFLTVYNQLNLANMEKFRLEVQLDQLRNSKPDAMDSILAPIAESFKSNPQGTISAIGSIFKPKAPPPSVSKPQSDWSTWDDSTKLSSILERLKKLDAEYISVLEMLTSAAEGNPDLLPFFKEQIKQHV